MSSCAPYCGFRRFFRSYFYLGKALLRHQSAGRCGRFRHLDGIDADRSINNLLPLMQRLEHAHASPADRDDARMMSHERA